MKIIIIIIIIIINIKNDVLQIKKELQTALNEELPLKPEVPPPPVQKSAKILNLVNIISNSLSSSSNNLYSLAGGAEKDKEKEKDKEQMKIVSPYSTTSKNNTIHNENDILKINDIGSISPNRPSSTNLTKSDSSTGYDTQFNFYSQGYSGDSESSSYTNSKQTSCTSLTAASSMNGINMTAIASAAASIASHSIKTLDITSIDSTVDSSMRKPISPTSVSFCTSSPQSPTMSVTSLIEKIKKLDFSKTGLAKKNNVEKQYQKVNQLFVDFINNINKNKKGTYLDQCFEIKNSLKKLFISSNIINQEGNIISTSSNQINLYYTSMLSLSKMILNVRDAVGKWPPPDVNQLIFFQIDDFLYNYQLLLNTINIATISNNEIGPEINISSPIINTNPSFLASVDMYGSNIILNKINNQISIIMMSISDLIIVSRKEQSINQNIYKLSIECRDNISTLANDIDDIHFKKRNSRRTLSQFIQKKESLINSIKELTITIKSSNEKFAPSNSLELILESLSFCINIIDDIAVLIKGMYDISDSPCLSQHTSFDMNENNIQDNYEYNKKLFGDQTSVVNGSISRKLEFMLKVKYS